MKLSFQWYGECDPVSLQDIAQIPGIRSIASAVYDGKPGEVWPEKSLARIKAGCEAHGLVFDVVDSIPVSEDIKQGRENRERLIGNYCENIRLCAKYGIKCVAYNFMPVFDPLTGEKCLPDLAADNFREEIRQFPPEYANLGQEGLWQNVEYFLKRIIPAAESCGVTMALRLDAPPHPVPGLPQIITCEENIDRYLAITDSPANALCLCAGPSGCMPSGNLLAIVRKYAAAGRIAMMQIHNTRSLKDGPLKDQECISAENLSPAEIVETLVETGFDGYISPGHSLYNRAVETAYLNGLWDAAARAKRRH